MNKSELSEEVQKGIAEMEARRRWVKTYQGRNTKSTSLAIKEGLDKPTLKAIHMWMQDEVILSFDRARRLCKDEVWANYQLLGISDLREQIILKKAITAILKHITKRPEGVVIKKECHDDQDQNQ